MKYINLSQGLRAKVDDDLYDWLSQWKWSAKAYRHSAYAVRTATGGKRGPRFLIPMHRQILGLDSREIAHSDHIDRDTLNNQRANLRRVNASQNQMNKAKASTNKTGYKGVRFSKTPGKFTASICLGTRYTHLGTFNTPVEAHAAYCKAAEFYYGEYARA